MRICSNCGMQCADTQARCSTCGGTTYPVRNQQVNSPNSRGTQGYRAAQPRQGYQASQQGYQAPQQGYQAPQQGYQAPQQGYQAPQQGYQAPQQNYYQHPAGQQGGGYSPEPEKKKSRAGLVVLLTILVLGVVAFTGFVKPGFLKDVFKPKEVLPAAYETGSKLDGTTKQGSTLEMGSIKEDGCKLTIPEGELDNNTAVSMNVMSSEEAKKYEVPEKFEMIGTPVDLDYEGNNGAFFGEQVKLTVYIPEDMRTDDGRVEDYVFWVFDEERNEYRYYEPDYVDLEKGVMEVTLPHFCINGAGKMTESEKVEYALETYCTQVVMMQSGQEKDAKTLSPYFEKKLGALKLSEKMKQELIISVINLAGSKIGDAYKANEDDLNDIGMAVDLTTASYNAYTSGDEEALKSKMNDLSATIIVDAVQKKIIEKGSLEEFQKAAGWGSNNVAEIGDFLGCIAGGDGDGAIHAVASMIENADPKVAVISKTVGYLGAKLDENFINWKDAEVEELYQVYKNGSDDFAVEAGDTEAFREYLAWKADAASIARWVQIDEIKDMQSKLPKSKYYDSAVYDRYVKNLTDNARDVAVDRLVEYYEKRFKQEKKVEKIKAEEQFAIRDMLNETNGALRSDNYGAFFGEKSYSMTERIKKLVNIRKYLSQFVDEDARQKDSYTPKNYNYGFFLNQYISFIANEGMSKEEATRQFCRVLKEAGLLKKEYDVDLDVVSMDTLKGSWEINYAITLTGSQLAQGIEDTLTSIFGVDMSGVAEVNTETQTQICTMKITPTGSDECDIEMYDNTDTGSVYKAKGTLTGNTLKVFTSNPEKDYTLPGLNGTYQVVKEDGHWIFKGRFDVSNSYMEGSCEYRGTKK